MQSYDPQTVPMKWSVTFRQEQYNCRPPGQYWIVRNELVEAPSAEQAEVEVKKAWRYNHRIEIKEVIRIDNEQQGK